MNATRDFLSIVEILTNENMENEIIYLLIFKIEYYY